MAGAGNRLVAIDGADVLRRVDTTTGTATPLQGLGEGAGEYAMTVTPDGVWIAELGGARLQLINADTGAVIKTVHHIYPVGVAARDGRVWTGDSESGTLRVYIARRRS